MKTKQFTAISILFLSGFLGACQQTTFGVDEAVWSKLNEKERNKVIDSYNKQKEIEMANAQKQKEKELENERNRREIELANERHRQEMEAQTAPINAVANAVASILGNSKKGSEPLKKDAQEDSVSFLRIQSIASNFGGRQILTIGDSQFEVSKLTKMSQAWVKGQKVELTKNEENLLYTVKIRNIDNGECVIAKKSKLH